MLSINLNSKIVNATPATAAQESYQFGWDAYAAGEPRSTCQNAQQRNGWNAALNAEAYANTSAYLMGSR